MQVLPYERAATHADSAVRLIHPEFGPIPLNPLITWDRWRGSLLVFTGGRPGQDGRWHDMQGGGSESPVESMDELRDMMTAHGVPVD